jgi:hypothetical protein
MDTSTLSRRSVLKAMSGIALSEWVASNLDAFADDRLASPVEGEPKIIVLACGGIRRAETFEDQTFANIPHLHGDLTQHCTLLHAAGGIWP